MLAECISANTLLMKEKKANNTQEQEITCLKSDKVNKEQDSVSIKKEQTSGNGLFDMYIYIRYNYTDKRVLDYQLPLMHIKQETKAEPQTTDGE